MSQDLIRAKVELQAAQARAGAALGELRSLAHFAGEEFGMAKRGHEYVERLVREREADLRVGKVSTAAARLNAAGMAAVTRNDRARRALELRSRAEVAKHGVVYARIALRWRKEAMNELLNARVAEGQGNTKRVKAHRERARKAADTAHAMDNLLAKLNSARVQFTMPNALSATRTKALMDASGGAQSDTREVSFSRSVPIFESAARARVAQSVGANYAPWAQRQTGVRGGDGDLAALLAADFSHIMVSIRDPATGTTRTVDAKNVDADGTLCDWWCQAKKVIGVVGPAAGAGVAAAGGALATKDPTAGAAVTGAGAMLAALGSMLGNDFQAGFDKGRDQQVAADDKPVWPWVAGALGIGAVAFVVVRGKS